jgi:hypothetical protein
MSAQHETVLQILRDAGKRGIHTFELRREYIGNPSQRIAELEARGHIISSTRERLNGDAWGARYVLERDADRDPVDLAPRPLNTAEAADAGALFTVEAEGPRVRGPYEDAA